MSRIEQSGSTEELEIDLLLEALFRRHGADFRAYRREALAARLAGVMAALGVASISQLQDRVLHAPGAAGQLLRALSAQPAHLFQDPAQALQVRRVLAHCLCGTAAPKIWLADCAGAEEAWSLAIMLAEEKLDRHTEIHATMANGDLLAEACRHTIAAGTLADHAARYRESGGSADLLDYFDVHEGAASLKSALRARITWSQYNLVTDASFNEFQLILCRRALADFDPVLRRRVLRLFQDSLARFGVLGIGSAFQPGDPQDALYQALPGPAGWYKRVG